MSDNDGLDEGIEDSESADDEARRAIAQSSGISYWTNSKDRIAFNGSDLSELAKAAMWAASGFADRAQAARNECFAAAFDYISLALYYGAISKGGEGWFYCPVSDRNFFPYTNACPYCAFQDKFFFAQGNKLESGEIGSHTRKILALCLQWIFEAEGVPEIEIYKAREPADLALYSRSQRALLLAEVKAAPLLTFPLRIMPAADAATHGAHKAVTVSEVAAASIVVPWKNEFVARELRLGNELCLDLKRNIEEEDFADAFFDAWLDAYKKYSNGGPKTGIFWWTNACGPPTPTLRPSTWPKRKGDKGYKTLSDGKTSVGMDRTDDLKKATYQVLKIAVSFMIADIRLTRGVLSNIHAVRHSENYLDKVKDLVLAEDADHTLPGTVGDMDAERAVFNLFDVIGTITKSHCRDAWLREVFRWSL